MELICIVCPNSCRLKVTEGANGIEVEGARCKRGKQFAYDEMTCPMRTVCTSVRTTVKGFPVVSVRTSAEIPKNKIFKLMQMLANVTVTTPLPSGSVVLSKVFDSDVDVITTTDMEI